MAWLKRRRRGLLGGVVLATTFLLLPVVGFEDPYSTVMVDREGRLLGATIAADGQWRFPPPASVPQPYVTAVMQFEDRRFYHHPGVDPLSIGRAVLENLRAGRVVSGASTLTMQVVRLARKGQARTWREKAIEALLALRLEWALSKREILTLYAAHAPFGGNVVGLEAATWRYFGREPAELTWAEAATLAVLPNSPALMHPGRNRDGLRSKRDRLLRELQVQGHLNAVELRAALAEPLPAAPYPLPQAAPHLLARGRAELQLWRLPRPGRIESSLDRQLQERATEVLRRHHGVLSASGIHNAAALVLDVQGGKALAYVGNVLDGAGEEHGQFVDVVSSPRSTGSVLKPLLYASMLEAGELLPHELVPDVPTRIGGFAPENFTRTHDGAVPAHTALARSLNVPAVRLLRDYGVDRFHRTLQRMGMTTLHRAPSHYGLSLILGGAEGTLWDLVGTYAGLARVAAGAEGGFFAPTYLQDTAPAASSEVAPVSAGAAYLTLEALLEVERPGVDQAWRRFASGRRVAWKTGTSFGFRDGWAIGVTPNHAVGVWVGNADGEGRPNLTGFRAAAPILFDLIDLLPEDGWFQPPHDDLAVVEICQHSGRRASAHCAHTAPQAIPRAGLATVPCQYCETIHCDSACQWRVHAQCEPSSDIRQERRFVLPPHMAWFYKDRHPSYRPPPEYRADCRQELPTGTPGALAMIYPKANAEVFIPRALDGSAGAAILEAAHRDPRVELFWHLDDRYLGATRDIHQMSVTAEPGEHVLTVVDERGERLERRFVVLAK